MNIIHLKFEKNQIVINDFICALGRESLCNSISMKKSIRYKGRSKREGVR